MVTPQRTGGILLAGGRSRRMGQDKALLLYEGRTFLERTLSTLRQLTPHLVIVADTADRYDVPEFPVIGDLYPDVGPVGGLVTGLVHLGPGAHFAVACDMPTLDPAVLRLLLETCAPALDAVVLMLASGPEPLCAVYRHTAEPKLRRYLDEGGRSARGALRILNTRYMDESALRQVDPTARSLTNINTPEDLRRLQGGGL